MKMMARFLLIVIMIAISTSGCALKETAEVTSLSTPVSTHEAALGEISNTYITAGEISAWGEIKVVAKMPGRVADVLVDLGDKVHQGQVLVRLEDEEYKAQVKQAEATLEAAKANLAKAKAGARTQELEQAKAALLQAEANYDYAYTNMERMKYLFENQAIAEQELEAAQMQLQGAETQYVTAQEQLSLIEEGATEETIDQLAAQVKQAEAALAHARIQLDNTVITAPMDGIIAKREIELGEMANQSVPMLTLVQDNPLRIITYVSQQAINYLEVDAAVEVKAEGKPFQGTISAIGPAADPLKKGFPVEVKLENQQSLLKPGMYVEIVFETEKRTDCVVVPKKAVITQGDKTVVYLVDEHLTAKLQEVTTGIADEQWVEITEGIKAGETVVIQGQHLLEDGMSVSVRNGSDIL